MLDAPTNNLFLFLAVLVFLYLAFGRFGPPSSPS